MVFLGLYNTWAYVHKLKFRFVQVNKKEGGIAHENDISAKEEAAQKGARLQKKNEDKEW